MSVLCIGIGVALGASLIWRAYDAYGDHDIALAVCGASFFPAAFAYLRMGRYPTSTPA